MLQAELPRHLQSRGFHIQRGVEQVPGAAKKHLNTQEFKQQQNALDSLQQEAQAVHTELQQRRQQESELRERLQSYERQAQEAEKELAAQSDIPQASMFTYKAALETAQEIIERQKKALAEKSIIVSHNEKLQAEIKALHKTADGLNTTITRLITEKQEEEKRNSAALRHWVKQYGKTAAQLEEIEKFFRWNPEANKVHRDYIQQQREEARKQEAERQQKALERERGAQREKERREAEQARELERQKREREKEHAQWLERKPVKVTLDGNRNMTVKEAVFALAPTLERMKNRGFDTQEIAEKLHEKGIGVKPPTLAKYLNEFRRGKEQKKDTPPPPVKTTPAPKPDRPATIKAGEFVIRPDIPLDVVARNARLFRHIMKRPLEFPGRFTFYKFYALLNIISVIQTFNHGCKIGKVQP